MDFAVRSPNADRYAMFGSDQYASATGTKADSMPEIMILGEEVLDRVRAVSEAVDRRVHQAINHTTQRPADLHPADS
jgi:hypothetical protein